MLLLKCSGTFLLLTGTMLSRELSDQLKWEEEIDLKTRERYDPLISVGLAPMSDGSPEVT